MTPITQFWKKWFCLTSSGLKTTSLFFFSAICRLWSSCPLLQAYMIVYTFPGPGNDKEGGNQSLELKKGTWFHGWLDQLCVHVFLSYSKMEFNNNVHAIIIRGIHFSCLDNYLLLLIFLWNIIIHIHNILKHICFKLWFDIRRWTDAAYQVDFTVWII